MWPMKQYNEQCQLFQLSLQVNGVNTAYSTHDDVVDIICGSGGTLVMKVITPVIKQQNVCQQIKSCFTPNTSPPDDIKKMAHSGFMKHSNLSKSKSCKALHVQKFRHPRGEILQTKMTLPRFKETVIGEISPSIPRRGKSECNLHRLESPSTAWTNSVDCDSIYTHEHLSPVTRSHSISSSPLRSMSFFTRMKMGGHAQASPLHSRQRSTPTTNEEGAKVAAVPLPASLQPLKSSDIAHQESQDNEVEEQEEESCFATALKKSKENILRKSLIKSKLFHRANTVPCLAATPPWKESPQEIEREASEEEGMSFLQLEILRANKERSNRLSMKQPRITEVPKTHVNNKKSVRNTLTKVLSERLDSMKYCPKSPDLSDVSDFDDTPGSMAVKSTSRSVSLPREITESIDSRTPMKPKVSPPMVKPKPSKKKCSNPTPRKASANMDNDSGLDTTPPPMPFKVMLQHISKESHVDSGDSMDNVNSEVNWKVSLKSSEWRVSPLVPERREGPTESKKVGAKETLLHSQSENSFMLSPPLMEEGNKRISFVNLASPEALKMYETYKDSIPNSSYFPGTPPPSQSILEEKDVKAMAHSPICISSSSSLLPPPFSTPPSNTASTTAEDTMFSVDKDQKQTNRLNPIQKSGSINLPSQISSPHEKLPRSLLSISSSPLVPPAFRETDVCETDGFWIENSTISSNNQPTLPPFSHQSTPSELSDAPHPLPSEPTLFDSNTSSQFLTAMSDVHNSPAVLSYAAPQSHNMAIPNEDTKVMKYEVKPEMEDMAEAMQKVADLSFKVSKIIPGKAKKPKRDLATLEAEQVCMHLILAVFSSSFSV